MKYHTFPVAGILPKIETEASLFLKNHPEYDGRGTVIAILDTGVDPGAPGLKITSDGRQKIIDVIDCTGSGDVPCNTIVKETTTIKHEDNSTSPSIVGLTGRKLTLGNWNNPTGIYRLGIKNTADLFPDGLIARFKKERKEEFEIAHHKLLTKVQQDSLKYDKLDNANNLKKLDFEHQSETLKDLIKNYEDPGITMDCVVFHDGEKWRAAIDTNQSGDLRNAPLLTNFSDEYQYACFGIDTMLNYSVNIYDEGEMLSIVTVAGSHGTHVAAISAANYPGEEELNGVAPGAQIVSLKVGDTRLGSMETGQGLVRAAIELSRLKVDLANMSYGEPVAIPNTGRFIQLLKDEVINKNGCIFVASGGNAGPALSTVGAPGGTMGDVIGVGAYVNHSMMDAEYTMLEKVTERPYTWSSRGPAPDGDIGVDIFAPGAAITSVPQYNLKKSQRMNGTSMSSPNCCGCLALIVSGLKKENIPFTPYQIKSAIKHTGKSINDPFGINFIQVEKTWQYLTVQIKDYLPSTISYDVTIPSRDSARGVYLREPTETSTLQELTVKIEPRFANSKDAQQNKLRLDFELRLALEASHDWIKTPEYCIFNNEGQNFKIRVDPSNLKPGLHYGSITAYDVNQPNISGLFTIPVTVCKPDKVTHDGNYIKYDNLHYSSGDISRNFIQVPSNSNFAEIIVSTNGREVPSHFMVHLIQLHPQTRYTVFENEFAFSLLGSGVEGEKTRYSKFFKVLPDVTLEVCLAQFWSILGDSNVSIEVKFHSVLVGVSSNTQSLPGVTGNTGGEFIPINSGINGMTRVDLFAPLRREDISPKITFDSVRQTLRPTDSVVSSLFSRDVLPDSKQIHELILSYAVKISESSTVSFRLPRFNTILYDSSLDNFGLYVYDCNKKAVAFRDIRALSVKLEEGEYTVKVQMTSASMSLLSELKSTSLVVDLKLAKSVSPSLYTSLEAFGTTAYKKTVLVKGERSCFWVGDCSTLPSFVKPGDLLTGSLDVLDGNTKLSSPLYTVSYLVPPEYKAKTLELGVKEPVKPDQQLLDEAVRDLEVSWIKKAKTNDGKLELIKSIELKYPTFLPLHKEKLGVLLEMESESLCEHAEKTLALIPESEVGIYFGLKHDLSQGHEKDKLLKKDMELRKEVLGLVYQAKATCYKNLIKKLESQDVKDEKAIKDALEHFNVNLVKFSNWIKDPALDNGSYLLLWVWQQRRLGYHGTALKHLQKYITNSKNVKESSWKLCLEEKRSILQSLDWALWDKYDENWNILKFPKQFCHF
ncbi:subtilase family-domain-containing protein [Globomyces pollinis-pini]|nr:subtilase family-domain-containing protein [Globomyces pollinis-pini]